MTDPTTPDSDETGDRAHDEPFVPIGFVPPPPPRNALMWLEPLGEQHNAADYAAWTSSMKHIAATPGLVDWGWPHEMTLEENLSDLWQTVSDWLAAAWPFRSVEYAAR